MSTVTLYQPGNAGITWNNLTKRRSRIKLSLGILSKKSKIVVRAGKLYSFKFLYGLFLIAFPVTPKMRPLKRKCNNCKANWRKRQLHLITGTSSQFSKANFTAFQTLLSLRFIFSRESRVEGITIVVRYASTPPVNETVD